MMRTAGSTESDGQWAQLPADPSLGAHRLEVADGKIVYEPLSPALHLYFIDSGQIRTYEAGPHGSTRLLEILGPGDWFGEAALAGADTHASQAVAASPAVLWAVPVEKLMDLLSRQPGAAAELIRQLAGRLQSAREDANRLVFDDCGARLIKALLRFSQTAAASHQDGEVTLRITHRQLAQAVGAARETISLALTQLRQQKLLRTGRNRLVFSPEALQAYCRTNGEGISVDGHGTDGERIGRHPPSPDGDGRHPASAARDGDGRHPASAAGNGDGRHPASAGDGDGRHPASADGDGDGRHLASAAGDGDGRHPASAGDGDGRHPASAAGDGDGRHPATAAADGDGSQTARADDDGIRKTGRRYKSAADGRMAAARSNGNGRA